MLTTFQKLLNQDKPFLEKVCGQSEKTQEDGTYTLGLYTAPQVWCHILDALYFIGQQELPNSPVYKILDEAISARLGIKRKPQ